MRRSAAHAALLAASQNRRFDLSPIDALIDIKVRCRLRRQIPVRLDFEEIGVGEIGVSGEIGVRVKLS